MKTLYLETESGIKVEASIDEEAADYLINVLSGEEGTHLILTTKHIEIRLPTSEITRLEIESEVIKRHTVQIGKRK